MRPQNLKNNPTYPSASRCADPKIVPNLPSRQVELFWQSMKNSYNIFHKKVLSEQEGNGSAMFHSRPRMKVELRSESSEVEIHLTREKKLRLTTSSKTPWNCLRNKSAFGWSSVSYAFCNRLSYIEHTNSQGKTQYLRRRNISLYFCREFHWKKDRGKYDGLYKKIFHKSSWLVTIC